MRELRHTVSVAIDSPLPLIDGDPTRLEQVFVNLLTNAAKYTPEGGRVEVRAAREREEVVFTVRDNGMGIPAEVLPKVFDLFAQDKRSLDRSLGGLGIGLTIVDRLVAMHHGSVSAESAGPGHGSTFTVRLPVSKSTVDAHTTPAMPTESRPRTILVVDDNVDNATGMGVLLRTAGHTVVVAHDGNGAIELVRKLEPEVVLLDIGLPGLDGYEVARRIRSELGSGILLIAVSGYAQEEDRQRSDAAGFDHHLAKPVKIDDVLRLIATPIADAKGVPAESSAGNTSAVTTTGG